MQFIASVNAG